MTFRGVYKFIGKTETITDNLNPEFVKSLTIRYLFEEAQYLKVAVYHISDFREEASVEQNLVGYAELCVHHIVRAPDGKLKMPLKKSEHGHEKLGNLLIIGTERKKMSNISYKIIFEGENFPPEYLFYRLNKQGAAANYLPIVESETSRKLKGEKKHRFNEIEVPSSSLIQDDENKNAMVEVYEWNKSGAHKSLGKKEFNITELMEKIDMKFPLGVFRALRCEKLEHHTFLDYIINGLDIALTIAIDFTGSNEHPSDPSSLHYFDLSRNQYLQAIQNVGQILENYDSDKNFSVLGFGATVSNLMDYTSHCFALNGNIFAPEISTLQGVIECYKKNLRTISFDGPTYFAPILNYMNRMVEYETLVKKQNKYYILLLMTDGAINDMDQTIDEIVRATSLPLSIIIVGIGNGNFSSMEVLDADETPLFSKKLNKKMERDIVQFVPFSQYKHDPVQLAKETLEEIPRQLVSYMNGKGIKAEKNPLLKVNSETFFDEDRRLFEKMAENMGYSSDKIKLILDKGLPTASMETFITHVGKGVSYINPLAN